MQIKVNENSIEVDVRKVTGEFELGIQNLALLIEFRPRTAPRILIELADGISDRDAVVALKALIARIELEGLPRFAAEEEENEDDDENQDENDDENDNDNDIENDNANENEPAAGYH